MKITLNNAEFKALLQSYIQANFVPSAVITDFSVKGMRLTTGYELEIHTSDVIELSKVNMNKEPSEESIDEILDELESIQTIDCESEEEEPVNFEVESVTEIEGEDSEQTDIFGNPVDEVKTFEQMEKERENQTKQLSADDLFG